MTKILLLVLSYGIGSISGSFLLGRWVLGVDVRHAGSGNAGTTNAMRVLGRKLGALTFLIDWLKGILAMLLVHWIAPEFSVPCALFCVLGHDFPFYMRWKGGSNYLWWFSHHQPLCRPYCWVFLAGQHACESVCIPWKSRSVHSLGLRLSRSLYATGMGDCSTWLLSTP